MPQLHFPYAEERIKKAGSRSTFLVIRRGDYVAKQHFHGVLPISYYEQALNLLRSRADVEPEVFVFSDEPDWCKQNLKLSCNFEVMGSYIQTTATKKGREDVDLYLMSMCNHAILANSSFAWWGAWFGDLQRRSTRTVIAPQQWFTEPSMDTTTVTPDRWFRI